MPDTENNILDGVVEEIVYENDDTGYRVFTVNCDGVIHTAVATCPPIFAGEAVTASGEWKEHPAYGRQFVCEELDKTFPYELQGMLKFLASGAVKGIGPATAQKIIDTFREDSFYIIESEPDRLTQIRGISREKAGVISNSFRATLGVRDILMQLSEFNVSPKIAMLIYKRFGGFAIDVINTEPYRLWDEIEEFSFAAADRIALENGFAPDSEVRICAFIKYVLVHNLSNGHSFLPFDKLTELAAKGVGTEPEETVRLAEQMIADGRLVSKQINKVRAVYLPDLYKSESRAADKLLKIAASPSREISNIDKSIDDLEAALSITYAENQRAAIRAAVENKVMVLTGGPGTGKTTTLNGIIRLFESVGLGITLCAPTGRAAKRMGDVCGKEAKTIHRLLEVEMAREGTFIHNESNSIKTDVVVVDEMSMVDIRLFDALLRAVPAHCRLIMVGDADQLPSVGPGNVFLDVIRSGKIKTVFLTEIFRQASESRMIVNAHRINRGEQPDLTNSDDFFFVRKNSIDSVIDSVCALVAERIPKKYGKDVLSGLQVIIPTKKTPTGTQSVNTVLRELVNKASKSKTEATIKNRVFRVGDKVMQTKNDYDVVCRRKNGSYESGVFNGDIGVIESIDLRNREISVLFDDRTALYDFVSAEELELAYAITIHKSQGSEFDIVLLVLSELTPLLQYRNLLYTAVTRARERLIIVGSEQVLRNMVNNNRRSSRYSGLRYALEQGSSGDE